MARVIHISTDHPVAFPRRCVRCRQPPQCCRTITASRGFDLVLLGGFHWEFKVSVPCCNSCARLHRLCSLPLGLAMIVGWILFGIALPLRLGSLLMDAASWWIREGYLLGGTLAVLYYVRNTHQRVADYWVLGIRGDGMTRDLKRARLRFADDRLANEVERESSIAGCVKQSDGTANQEQES